MPLEKRCGCPIKSWNSCGHNWVARVYVKRANGERFTTGTADKAEAEQFERQFTSDLYNQRAGEAGAPTSSRALTLWRLLTLDLEGVRATGGRDSSIGASEGYIRQNTYAHSKIRGFFDEATIARDVTYDKLNEYINWRRAQLTRRGKAPSGNSIAFELQILRRAVLDAASRGLCRAPIKWPEIARGQPDEKLKAKDHGVEVVHRYIQALPEHIQHVCLFAMATGYRESTVAKIRPEFFVASDVQGVPAFCELPGSVMKGRKARRKPIPEVALRIVRLRVAAGLLTPNGNVFSFYDYRKATARALQAIDYSDTITLRDLRKTFANEVRRSGADLEVVRELLDHADIRTTQRYLEVRDDELGGAIVSAQKRLSAPADSLVFEPVASDLLMLEPAHINRHILDIGKILVGNYLKSRG